MKLYNAIAIFDVYIVAESGESAREALIAAFTSGDLAASEVVATETLRDSIRESWRGEKPLVAGDISDADFKQIKGRSTVEIFQRIYTKPSK